MVDVIVLGGGPAGCTAAMYAARAGLSTLLLEKATPGGQMGQTLEIENYPGFENGVDGFTLGQKMAQGALRAGARMETGEVTAVSLDGAVKTVTTREKTYRSRVVMIATGADHRHLGLPDEASLVGRGVSYCAACDAPFYRGKTVAVIGGGNSAVADAMTLSRVADHVTLIHRRDTLRAPITARQALERTPNIEILWNTEATALGHDNRLRSLTLRNISTGAESNLPVDGVFISIGRAPATALFRGQLRLDSSGYIVADETTITGLPGVYALGDVRTKDTRQIVTATADGAAAAHFAQQYLDGVAR